MERPNDLGQLYRKMLPAETQTQVLLKLPASKLLEMCEVDSSIFDPTEARNTEGICDDYLFWKNKLKEDGIELLPDFELLIDRLKAPLQSRASFIQKGFYLDPRITRTKLLNQLQSLWQILLEIIVHQDRNGENALSQFREFSNKIFNETVASIKQFQQLCLDFEFYFLQMKDYSERQNGEPSYLTLPSDFVSFSEGTWSSLLDEDRKKVKYNFNDFGYLSIFEVEQELLAEIDLPREVTKMAQDFDQNLLQIRLETYERLLREGDIVETRSAQYFVTERNGQIWLTEFEKNVLPEVAVDFLIRKKIVAENDLHKLYGRGLSSFIWQGKKYTLAEVEEPFVELKIKNHVFHILKAREKKVPSAPVKRKPLARTRPTIRQPNFDDE